METKEESTKVVWVMNNWCFDRFQELGLRGIFCVAWKNHQFCWFYQWQSMPMLWIRGGCQLSHLFMETQIVLKGVWDLGWVTCLRFPLCALWVSWIVSSEFNYLNFIIEAWWTDLIDVWLGHLGSKLSTSKIGLIFYLKSIKNNLEKKKSK